MASTKNPGKTFIDPSFSVSEDDLKHFQEKGFLLLKGFFSKELIQYIIDKIESELSSPTDKYQSGFNRVRYDLFEYDAAIKGLMEDRAFRGQIKKLTERQMIFTHALYIMAKTAPSGITGNTSFGRLLNEPELVDRADALMQHLFSLLGVTPHGFFTADFKEDAAGVPMLTEVNVRMVAFNYSFAQAGANFSADIVRYLHKGASALSGPTRYAFGEGTCFVRDVDTAPRLMNERDLRVPAAVRTTTVNG